MTRILVVEDEPAIAIGLKDDLEVEGYSVDVAEDGALAMDAALSRAVLRAVYARPFLACVPPRFGSVMT